MEKSYPWDVANDAHLLYAMSDAELVAAIREALEQPECTGVYLQHMREATRARRWTMRPDVGFTALDVMDIAEITQRAGMSDAERARANG